MYIYVHLCTCMYAWLFWVWDEDQFKHDFWLCLNICGPMVLLSGRNNQTRPTRTWPCSKTFRPGKIVAPSMSTCFMLAGFTIWRLSGGNEEIKRVTIPVTTGDATDVPDRTRQPPPAVAAFTSLQYAITSGLLRPKPAFVLGLSSNVNAGFDEYVCNIYFDIQTLTCLRNCEGTESLHPIVAPASVSKSKSHQISDGMKMSNCFARVSIEVSSPV